MDPKADADIDSTFSKRYCTNWIVFCKIWNRESQSPYRLPETYTPTWFAHDQQAEDDYNNCGIYTLTVSFSHSFYRFKKSTRLRNTCITVVYFSSQFVKRYLTGQDLGNIDPAVEGAEIAGEIMDCSSLSNHCIKCGGICDGKERMKICSGTCRPHRHFHEKCLPVSHRTVRNFKCQICDPTLREEYCFSCGGKPDGTILNCKNMCEAFVHSRCLPPGMTVYRCGICMI